MLTDECPRADRVASTVERLPSKAGFRAGAVTAAVAGRFGSRDRTRRRPDNLLTGLVFNTAEIWLPGR